MTTLNSNETNLLDTLAHENDWYVQLKEEEMNTLLNTLEQQTRYTDIEHLASRLRDILDAQAEERQRLTHLIEVVGETLSKFLTSDEFAAEWRKRMKM